MTQASPITDHRFHDLLNPLESILVEEKTNTLGPLLQIQSAEWMLD